VARIVLDFKEAAVQSDRHSVSPVVRLQFGKYIANMSFNGVLANVQAVRYELVRAALCYQFQNFHFPLCQ
jgi:hypothetical protein